MKKYRFDDDSLNFVEDRKRVSRVLFSVVKYLVVSFVLFFSVYLFCSVAFDTDYQSDIKVENREISREYAEVSKKMELLDSVIYDIKARDAMIYVAMFNSEPVDQNNMNAIVNLLAPIHGDEPFRVFEDIEAACRGISGYTGRLESLYSRMSSKADSLRYIPSILPLKNMDSYQVSASVGMKMNPFYKQFARHEGIDILSAEGEEIIATADGVVTEARRSQGEDGNMIVIRHGRDYEVKYMHVGSISVRKGETVERGDVIGKTGNSGISLLPHIHYEVRYKGEIVDPLYYFFQGLRPDELFEIMIMSVNSSQTAD